MAWPARRHFDTLVQQAEQSLHSIHIVRLSFGQERALIDLEGMWGEYRIILSEIHRSDTSRRYAYYVLNSENRMLVGFDNSSDVLAIKMRYGDDWRQHLHEEIPHLHDDQNSLQLTDQMDISQFFKWLRTNLPDRKAQ